jgi:TetR/AcrR family transcriptional repressor of mexJK operon
MAQARTKSKARPSKRERVVSAAAKLFLSQGYGATGMDAIANEAGISKATVYSYYGDKASLFADVMVRMCEEIGGPMQAEALSSGPPEEVLRAIALHGVQRVLEAVERRIVQRVVAEAGDFPELGRKFWETGPARFEALCARYLGEARRQGVLHVDDPVQSAARLTRQLTGLYALPILAGVRGRPSEAEIRRDLDEIIAGFLATARRRK